MIFSDGFRLAKQGDLMAAHNVAEFYDYGNEVEQDKSEAEYWYNETVSRIV